MRSSLFPLLLTATAFIQGLQVSYRFLAVAFQLVSLPPLLSHSTSSFTVSRIIFLEELSQLRFQSGSEKIYLNPLVFIPVSCFNFICCLFLLLLFSYSCPAFFPIAHPYPIPPLPQLILPPYSCPRILYLCSFACTFPFPAHPTPSLVVPILHPLWLISLHSFPASCSPCILCCITLNFFLSLEYGKNFHKGFC